MIKKSLFFILFIFCSINILSKEIDFSNYEKDLFLFESTKQNFLDFTSLVDDKNCLKSRSDKNSIQFLIDNNLKDFIKNNLNLSVYHNMYAIFSFLKFLFSDNNNYSIFFENLNNINKRLAIYQKWDYYKNISRLEKLAFAYIYDRIFNSLNIEKLSLDNNKKNKKLNFYSYISEQNILYNIDNKDEIALIFNYLNIISYILKDSWYDNKESLKYKINYHFIKDFISNYSSNDLDEKELISFDKFIDKYISKDINIEFEVLDYNQVKDNSNIYYFIWDKGNFIRSNNEDQIRVIVNNNKKSIDKNIADDIDYIKDLYTNDVVNLVHLNKSIKSSLLDIFNFDKNLLKLLMNISKEGGILAISVSNNDNNYVFIINKLIGKDLQYVIIDSNNEDMLNIKDEELNILKLFFSSINSNKIDNANIQPSSNNIGLESLQGISNNTNNNDYNIEYNKQGDDILPAEYPKIGRSSFAGDLPKGIEDLIFILKSDTAKKLITKMPSMAIMHGPAGTGKTTLAEILSYETGRLFKSIKASELFDKFYGESQKKLRDIFKSLKNQCDQTGLKAVLFIDEIDAIASLDDEPNNKLRSDLRYILNDELDRINNNNDSIFCICATNKLGLIDPTVITRSQGYIIKVDKPDYKQRKSILEFYLKGRSCNLNESFINDIVKQTDDFSSRELRALIDKSALLAIRSGKDFVSKNDLYLAINILKKERDDHLIASDNELHNKAKNQIKFNNIIYQETPWFNKDKIIYDLKEKLLIGVLFQGSLFLMNYFHSKGYDKILLDKIKNLIWKLDNNQENISKENEPLDGKTE